MIVYHNTFPQNVTAILDNGFRDHVDRYLTGTPHRGVWFIDSPDDAPDPNPQRTVWFGVVVPDAIATQYEWPDEGHAYREFLIPASVANLYGRQVVDATSGRESDPPLELPHDPDFDDFDGST